MRLTVPHLARAVVLGALVLAGIAQPVGAQAPRRSQRGAVMQMLGTTRVEVTYIQSARRALIGENQPARSKGPVMRPYGVSAVTLPSTR